MSWQVEQSWVRCGVRGERAQLVVLTFADERWTLRGLHALDVLALTYHPVGSEGCMITSLSLTYRCRIGA